MTPLKGIKAIGELSEHSLSWGKEGNTETKEMDVVVDQISNFNSDMNIITEEVRMVQHNLPSTTETNPRGLAHAITTRSRLNYKPLQNPLENNLQTKPLAEETSTSDNSKEPDKPEKTMKSHFQSIPFPGRLKRKRKRRIQEASQESSTTEHKHSIYRGIRTNAKICQEKDPGSFTIPCIIGNVGINKALADLKANISLIPYSMFTRLGLGELKPTRMCIELANKTTQYPRGIAENVIVKIDKFVFPVDFVVLYMEEDHKIPIILGRPFLATAHAMIDVFNKKISFKVRNETVTFDIEKSMKFSSPEDGTCLSIDMVKLTILDHAHEILPLDTLDSFLFEPIINYQEGKIINLWEDDNDEADSQLFSNQNNEGPTGTPTLFTANTKEPKKQISKLKEFPSKMLERLSGNEYYCFLDGFFGYFQIPLALEDQEKLLSPARTGLLHIGECPLDYAML
ncbi:DNA-directed DNA polymerase [Tanacetum coccineum]